MKGPASRSSKTSTTPSTSTGRAAWAAISFPIPAFPRPDGFAPAEIARRCRAAPGDYSLLCIGPLKNVALALVHEPDLPALLDEAWVMGGAVHCRGNVTPAAEYNVWVDPDAAMRVFDAFEVTLVDWGLTLRDSLLAPDDIKRVQRMEGELAAFMGGILDSVYAFTETEQGGDGVPQPDSLTAALPSYPELREQTSTHPVEVDEREGLTRGYLSVDVDRSTDAPAQTRVIESAAQALFCKVVLAMLRDRAPDAVL